MKNYIKILMTGLVMFVTPHTFAQQLIPFQARLTDGAGVVVTDGVYSVNFNIYDAATAGTTLWTENHSTVSVVGGVVNVILGSITPLNDPDNNGDLSDAVTFYNTNGNRFIGVTISAGQEMVPRHELVPSFHSVTADDATHAVNADDATKLGGNLPSFYTSLTQHNADIQALTNQITGMVSAFVTSCPTDWLLADGTSGTPDLRGRFLRGDLAGNPTALGFGGNDNAIAVAHSHGVGSLNTSGNGAHSHTVPLTTQGGAYGDRTNGSNSTGGVLTDSTNSAGNHTHTVTGNTASTGVTGTNANIPKYYEVVYCIKQ